MRKTTHTVVVQIGSTFSPRRMGKARRNPSWGGGEMGFGYRLYPFDNYFSMLEIAM